MCSRSLLPRLRAFVRHPGPSLGKSIGPGREALDRWLKGTNQAYPIPEGAGGITTVRNLAQWALNYHADGSGQGFPFDLPWLNFYSRCLHLLAALETFLRTPPTDVQVRKSLEALRRILHPVKVDQPPCASVGDALIKRADLFDRLRAALRLEEKNPTVK